MKRIVLVGAVLASLLMACGEEEESPLTGIALVADAEFTVGTTVQLRVIGTRKDGSEDRLTKGVTFASSDPEIATVDPATGLATVLVGGPVSFTAQLKQFHASLEARTRCLYPRFADDIVFGRTMPPLSWPAKRPDGSEFVFDFRDVYCDKEWQHLDTLVVITSAAWCQPCTRYAQMLSGQSSDIKPYITADTLEEEHNSQILYIMAQDTQGEPISTADGYKHMDRIISTGRIPGIVVGDLETAPEEAYVQNSSMILAFPAVWVIRTRDMKIIASGNRTDQYLDLYKIADNPERDWSAPGKVLFRNKCGAGDEEATEPNDEPADATPIGAGTFSGGICRDYPDFYSVGLAGTWEARLAFDGEVGDLDIYVWDPVTNEPARFDGQIAGSTGETGEEVFEFTGPALVGVVGFKHASAPYTLTITEK